MSDRYITTTDENGNVVSEDLYAPFFETAKNPHSTGFVIEIVLLVFVMFFFMLNLPVVSFLILAGMIALRVVRGDLFKKDTTMKEKIERRNEFVELLISEKFIDEMTSYDGAVFVECVDLDPLTILVASSQPGKTPEQIEAAASKGLMMFDALTYEFSRTAYQGRKNVFQVIYRDQDQMEAMSSRLVSDYSAAVGD